MNVMKVLFIFVCLFSFSTLVFSQKTNQEPSKPTVSQTTNPAKASPAYAELLLRRAELESDVEGWLETYTEDYPRLKAARFELDLINKDLTKLLAQTDVSKLTLALGKLLVRKNQIETDLWALENQYGKDYPEVKRNQRKLESFQKSIKEILP